MPKFVKKENPVKFTAVEKEQPLNVYSFPNIDGKGTKISVKARNQEEALQKALKEVKGDR